MSQRSYNQYCPIAHTLDLVGERWSLLIVRDLLLGPKRFSDLREGLPGIGTNILTDRLKGLEQCGLITRRQLPPPAASAVYELTPYGQQLDGPIQALAQWGGQSLGARQPNQALSRDTILLTARALARRLLAISGLERIAFRLTDAQQMGLVSMRMEGHSVVVETDATQAEAPTLQLDAATLFALAGGKYSLQEALQRGLAHVEGSAEVVARLYEG